MTNIALFIGGNGPAQLTIPENTVASIAADSGLHLADAHNLDVDLIVGDLDSVDLAMLKKYEDKGSYVSRFEKDKDQTDFELALLASCNYVADTLSVFGGGGGQLSHALSVLSVLSGPQTEKWVVDMHTDKEHIYVCRPGQPRTITGNIGDPISIVPIGPSANVSTKGCKWQLDHSILDVHSARGISNEFIEINATIEVSSGSVVIICEE